MFNKFKKEDEKEEEVVAPVEETVAPVEEAPVEEAPVEEAPVVEAPVEEAPVVEAIKEEEGMVTLPEGKVNRVKVPYTPKPELDPILNPDRNEKDPKTPSFL